ncbi:MAG TPA: proprotein convertase P-domain-containing protein [bacterium]|jgi:subtilisin-like proprotein convertase family protein
MKKLLAVCILLALAACLAYAGHVESTVPVSAKAPANHLQDANLLAAKAAYSRWLETGQATAADKELMDRYIFSTAARANGLDANGGPDGFGYRYADNQAPDTSTFGWIELSGDPSATQVTSLTSGTTDDGYFTIPAIGFSFPIYDGAFSSVSMCTNGFLDFGATSTSYANSCLPTSNFGIGKVIMPYWDDQVISLSGLGGMWYKNFGPYFVAEWDNVSSYSGEGAASYEVILWPDGKFKVQYNYFGGTHGSATVGMQDGTLANFLQYSCNTGSSLAAGRSITFVPPSQSTTGRCCYDAGNGPLHPGCAINTLPDCAALNGTWVAGIESCDASPCPVPTAGEFCAVALPLLLDTPYSGTTVGFINNYDYLGSFGAPDVVYSYTAPTDQQVTFSLCGSSFDTYLYVYADNCTGTPIAYSDDDYTHCQSSSSYIGCLQLTGGHTYYIVVDGYSSNVGAYNLIATACVQYPVPPNNDCANAAAITVNGDVVCATTLGATNDCATIGMPEVWYMFTTDACMDLRVSYCGTSDAPSLASVLMTSCCEGTIYNTSVEYTTCADGKVTIHFGHLAAGTYYLPVGLSIAGDFCVSVAGEACPPPFQCHASDPQDGRVCNMTGGPINDTSENSFPIVVPAEYHITDVNLSITLTHTYDGDLHIWLESPLGTAVVLSNRRGSSGDNFTCTTFDDQATTAISAGVAPFEGSFIPDAPLAAFNGENAAGTWICHVDDQAGGDFGAVEWVCLTFTWDQILAVELANFAAVAGDNSVSMSWSTASESDNDHFELVRDGQVVARVAATNNAAGSHYTWTDNSAVNGTLYHYSLVAVDANGARTELRTASVTPSFGSAAVTEYALHQNYPNPFNPTTSIALDLVDNGFVSLKVYNLMGQEVASLVNGNLSSGRHIVSFDATSLSSGVYLYRLNVNGFVAEKKMLLMK